MVENQSGPCDTVAKGGVGESGANVLLSHRVTGEIAKMMVLRNVESSLCGNTGAVAIMTVNGVPVDHGVMTSVGSSIQAEANPGDYVVAVAHTIPLFNEIACIRLGELSLELDECDLV